MRVPGQVTRSKGAYQRDVGCETTTEWNGWSGIKYAFTFGDSYTSTGFNHGLTAPSPSNPLGNPPYPGLTSANGTNWVGFLTTKYNSSLLQTYNLAIGGATVDRALVPPFLLALSLKEQITEVFLPFYVSRGLTPATAPAAPAWKGNDTVFVLWIGINDVGNSYHNGEEATSALNVQIFAVYADLIMRLYQAGARNFVFVNIPPMDRSPLTINKGKEARELERKAILAFNHDIDALARNSVKAAMQGVNVWVLDAYESFGQVLDDPASHEATKGYKNTTEFCEAYGSGTPKQDTFNHTCGVPVNQYFWFDSLHPTSPMHEVIAVQLAKVLGEGPNVCNFQSGSNLGRVSGETRCLLIIFAFLIACIPTFEIWITSLLGMSLHNPP